MSPEMRRAAPFFLVIAIAVVIVLAVAGGLGRSSSEPSPSPSAAVTPSALASPPVASPSVSVEPSASASEAPSATPTATAVATSTPPAEACAVEPQEGLLPSDRVVAVEVATSPEADFVTFVFEPGSLTPAGPPRGDLTVAEPPFTFGPSGLPIDLAGDNALQVRFSGMSLSNDVGEPTFTGDPDITVDYPALKQAIMYDESEGIAAWYIGYDGTGCVNLLRDGDDVVVSIAHS
jgi:hypothetical protein